MQILNFSWLHISAYSVYFNAPICAQCLIKSEANYDLVQRQSSVHFSLQKKKKKRGVRMCSTFLIPKTLQASLTTKNKPTSWCECVCLPPRGTQSFLGSAKCCRVPRWSRQTTEADDCGTSLMLDTVSRVLSGKVYSSIQCGQWKYMMSQLFGLSQTIQIFK